jgi:hypothetical protein
VATSGTLGDVLLAVAGVVLLLCQYMLSVSECSRSSYLSLEDVTLLEDLLNNIFFLVASELVVKLAVGCSVEDTSGALSGDMISLGGVWWGSRPYGYVLVRNEDLEAADNLSERDRLVGLPVTDGLGRFDKDDVVVVASLEVDLDLGGVSSHICDVVGSEWLVIGVKIGGCLELLMNSCCVMKEGRMLDEDN